MVWCVTAGQARRGMAGHVAVRLGLFDIDGSGRFGILGAVVLFGNSPQLAAEFFPDSPATVHDYAAWLGFCTEARCPAMKSGAQETIKFKRLQRRLKLPMWQAIGLLESIWQLTSRSAPRGDIGKYSNDDIASWLEYSGDENELIAALIDSGWLDECSIHRLIVHDWSEHAPNFVKGNVIRHLGGFATIPKGPSPGDTPRDTPRDTPHGIVPPSLAKPSLVKSSQSKGGKFKKPSIDDVEAYRKEKGYTFDPEAFVAHYESNGWKVGKNPMKSWQACCVTWHKNSGAFAKNGEKKPPASRVATLDDLRGDPDYGQALPSEDEWHSS